ncbi:putative bicyclomycin resistance protein [Durotheca rogersii]|uniref:putative bicyclomycin resistance protein n=1 Tax=Durotheca rogersii TaxID=419775 RepID=UPI002220B7D1|nr:putative bicyclomycin resistance protein [Durotheca rogersii]KAI5865330.1 putative bicyclomycin resistance protein [Durotheca rogersii]
MARERTAATPDSQSTVGETPSGEATPLLGNEVTDEYIVSWDEHEDPEHPYSWPRWRTLSNCLLISGMTFLTALASAIIAPGVPQLMAEFQSQNLQLAAFVVSVYILGFAAGPLVTAPMSEIYGRVVVYHVCNVGFTIGVIGCALAPSIEALVVFRFISGTFGSCPATIGGGSIADMVPQERRASVMAGYTVGALFAPILGPILGGFLTDALGWRSNFWLLAIAGAFLTIMMMIMLRETYHPYLLERKTARLRKETGNKLLRSKLDAGLTPSEYFLRNIIRPVKMLTRSPVIIIMSLFIAITYGYMYLMFTSFAQLFKQYYGFSTKMLGVAFLGLGVGSFIGVAIFSATSDKTAKRLAAEADARADALGTEKQGMKPEYRLPPLPFAVLCMAFGLLVYGWTAYYQMHWIVPILGTTFIGIGQLVLFLCIQMYLIDTFTVYAASAIASFTVVRSVAGAVLPLCGLQLYDTFGIGWGNTLLAAVCLPLVFVAVLMMRQRLLRQDIPVAKTTIPIPKAHAYSIAEYSPVGTAFLIMDYS